MASMKVVAGLGNIGERYLHNRHNAGFMAVEALAKRLGNSDWQEIKKYQSMVAKNDDVVFVKPTTMMNNAGKAIKNIITQYKVKQPFLWVIYDDLDIKLGSYKIQKGKGPKTHKGLVSIYENIGKKDFWHVRLGVDNRQEESRISGESYVLDDFNSEEMVIFQNTLEEVLGRLETMLIE